jgi:hypothetical protein
MTYDKAMGYVAVELDKAERKFPGWPDDPVHGAGIICEESGELMQASLDFYYNRNKDPMEMLREAAHTAATAIRFIMAHDDIVKAMTILKAVEET